MLHSYVAANAAKRPARLWSTLLSQIAHELDEAEHRLMLESGMESADYLRFMAEESGNVAGEHP
jgi:hypothetical protein